jgi:O-antigen/teichoic acid export membrane protein
MQKEKNEFRSLSSLAISIFQRDIFILFLAILTGIIVARTLGPQMLGVWVLLSLVSLYSEAFGRLKTDIASVYIIGSGKAKSYEVFFSTSFFALTSSLIIIILLFWQLNPLHDLFFLDSQMKYHLEFTFLILLIPFEFVLLNNLFFLLAIENVVSYNKIKVLRQIVHFGSVVLLLTLGLELWSLVIARLLNVFIALIYSFFCLDRKELFKGSLWNGQVNQDILSYAVNFYSVGVIAHVQELSVRTISAFYLSTAQVAFYSQGEAASKLLHKIPEALTTILYPRISRIDKASEAIDLSCRAFRVTLIILIFIGLALFLIAEPLVILLYGIEFELSASVLAIAIPGIIIGSSCLTLKTFFEGSGQASVIPKVQTIPVIAQVVLAYYMISLYGLMGASISFSVGFSLYGLAVLLTFLKVNKISFYTMIPKIEDLNLLYKLSIEKYFSKNNA